MMNSKAYVIYYDIYIYYDINIYYDIINIYYDIIKMLRINCKCISFTISNDETCWSLWTKNQKIIAKIKVMSFKSELFILFRIICKILKIIKMFKVNALSPENSLWNDHLKISFILLNYEINLHSITWM